MKHVYNNIDIIAHLWAHAHQDSARNSGNFYFSGPIIYSYGAHFPIAKRLGQGAYTLTTRTYGVTTAKHIHTVEWAIPAGALVLKCDNPLADCKAEHIANLEAMADHIAELSGKASRARSKKHYILQKLENEVSNFRAYVGYFRLKVRNVKLFRELLETGEQSESLQDMADRMEAHRRAQEKARRERLAREKTEMMKNAREALEDWKTGALHYLPSRLSQYLEGTTALRLVANAPGCIPPACSYTVQSSRGAQVPVSAALVLFKVCCKAREKGKGYKLPKLSIGGFSPVAVSYNGNAVVGCHNLKFDEMERVFNEAREKGLV